MTKFYKITRTIIIIICFFCVSFSCGKEHKTYDTATTIKCLNCSDKMDYQLINNIFLKTEYIQLETTTECLIREIDYIQIVDTFIFVVDDNFVYQFSKISGKFLSKIGDRGQGPSEYISVKSLFADDVKQTIIILDLAQSKMVEYDFNGNYISSSRFGVNTNMTNTALYMKNGNVLYQNELSPYSKYSYSIYKANANSMNDLLSYGNFKLKKYSLAFSKHPMTYSKNGINCIMPYDNKIYFVNEEGDLDAKYSVEYSGKPTNMKEAQKEDPPMFITRQLMAKENHFPGYTAVFETAGKLLLNTFDNKPQAAFFYADIDSLKGKYYSYSLSPEELEPVFEIVNVSENQFIAKLNSSQLYGWKEHYKDLNKIPNQQLRIIIENSEVDNNPCIVIYDVK